MSEKQYSMPTNGQQLQRVDINTIAESAARVDDHILASLLQLAPGVGTTVSRGILPLTTSPLIAPNGATGSVLVAPFRALIGSRADAATDARKNIEDIRSGLSVAEGSTSITSSVSLASNASGYARWDLIYVAVTVDATTGTVTRKVKSPTTNVVSSVSVAGYSYVSVAVAALTGVINFNAPVWPATPADSGTTYYIPLGYVRVPDGFGSGSSVANKDLAIIAPILALPGVKLSVPTVAYNRGTATQNSWAASNSRPNSWMPTSMGAGETLLMALDITTSTGLASGSIIDTRDWRGRLCHWKATTFATAFPWVSPTACGPNGAAGTFTVVGQGQTMSASPQERILLNLTGSTITGIPGTATIKIVADHTTGNLVLTHTNTPNTLLMVWMEFSGVYDNA